MAYSLVSENIVSTSGSIFVISAPDGQIRPGTLEGLYAFDTRCVSEYLLTVDGQTPVLLRSHMVSHSLATFYATSADAGPEQGGVFSIVRDRYVSRGMHEDVTIQNHSNETRRPVVSVSIKADFADLFEVRSGQFHKTGQTRSETLDNNDLRMVYERGDFSREVVVHFTPVTAINDGVATFQPNIGPRTNWKLCISILPVSDENPAFMQCADTILGASFGAQTVPPQPIRSLEIAAPSGPLSDPPALSTIHRSIHRAYDRSIDDLRSLAIRDPHGQYILAAGLPWFMTIFGRDSIISAMQTKILSPDLMFNTLNALASYQATETDDFREAQPGKIPHEIREGELSEFQEVPHSRYYGSVDATPLYLMLLAEAFQWTGDIERTRRLLPPAEAALNWIDEFGDSDGDGFVEYTANPHRPLRNQCWKDSGDSISFSDGTLAQGPIAVAEVQGYVYAAKVGMSEIYDALGEKSKAGRLHDEAESLRQLFDDAFWMPEEGFYAIALDGEKRQVDSVSSNPGHCMWSGMLYRERAVKVTERLMAPDMFNGWGIRTLSSEMARYHPVSYHNGSVWPHDTSLLATGFARYGFYDQAEMVISGLLDAAAAFPNDRLPELFAGFPRRAASFPVPYPSANAPQAWAAGAIPAAVSVLLRLRPDGERLVSDIPSISRPISITGIHYRGREWGF